VQWESQGTGMTVTWCNSPLLMTILGSYIKLKKLENALTICVSDSNVKIRASIILPERNRCY
jgi:hypothetical protein